MRICAREIMTADVVCVPEEMTVQQLARLLRAKHITGAPVLDAKGALVGVVSMADLIFQDEIFGEGPVLESDYYKQTEVEGGYASDDLNLEDGEDRRVREIMSPEVITARADTPLEDLAGIMYSQRIHRVIVVEDGRVCGIVSTMDILKVVMEGPEATARRGVE